MEGSDLEFLLASLRRSLRRTSCLAEQLASDPWAGPEALPLLRRLAELRLEVEAFQAVSPELRRASNDPFWTEMSKPLK